MLLRLRISREWFVLAVVLTGLSISTLLWAARDATPPAWDPADHLSAAWDYYRPIRNLDVGTFLQELFLEPSYYAPAVHLVTAVFFLLFGPSIVAGVAVNLVSMAILFWSLLFLARRCFSCDQNQHSSPQSASRPRRFELAGVTAAIVATCYHFPAWLMHDAFLDYALMAIVSLSYALLVNAGDFRTRRKAVLFGIAAGTGLLTKQTFAMFFVLPAVYLPLRAIIRRDREGLINLGIAGLIAGLIAAVWYVPHYREVIDIYRVNQLAAVSENEAPLFSLGSNLYYIHALISTQMQLVFGLIFIAGLGWSLIHFRRGSILLYLWLLSGVGTFTFVANKDGRYTVPVLPAAALVSVSWLARRRPTGDDASPTPLARAGRITGAALLCGWAFVSFANAQWPREGKGFYLNAPRFEWLVFARNYYGLDHRPLASDWAVPAIVRAVTDDWRATRTTEGAAPARRRPTAEETISPPTRDYSTDLPTADLAQRPTLGVVVNLPFLNPSSIALYARLMSTETTAPPLINVDWLVVEASADRLDECQYLLVRSGLEHAEWVAPVERVAERMIAEYADRYSQVASFALPLENARAVLYRCSR